MSNARISEQILTRLLCKRMGAALVGNTRLGTIDLGDVHEVRVSTAPGAREFELEVECPERTFRFQAEDDDDRGRWVEGLTAALRSVGPPAEGSAAGGVEVTDVDGSGIITVQWRLPPGSGCSDSDYLALCAARCTRPLASDLSRWAALLTPTAALVPAPSPTIT